VTASHAAVTLGDLARDFWEGVLRRGPTLATFFGDYRYNDRLADVGPAARANERIELSAVVARLDPLRDAALDIEDRITWDMLRLAAQAGLDALRYRLDELAIDQMDGPQVWLPELLNWHPTDTPRHVEELISRYQAFGTFMDQYLANLRDGIHDGRTAPTIAVERVIGQLRALLSVSPDQSSLSSPASDLSEPLATGVRTAVATVVYPAFDRMLTFLDDYLVRHARTDPGIWAVSDGDAIYALLARQHTTTELSPSELHRIGLEDLGAIHGEMRAIMARGGAAGLSIRAFGEHLIHDPANLPTSREEILQRAEELLAKAQAALPRAFGRLPRLPVVVKAIEEFRERDAPAAFYYQASADGTRPATFYMNTFEPLSRPKHTLPALAFHEGVPGHHLQIALGQESTNLPEFRRLSAGWLGNAFVEGWALYSERLADELGLYEGDLARYGMLGYQAWRACRLVVDTGLHHLRWTRQQAIEFFYNNAGLTERETLNEIDRYIVWPGQALGYKIGQREIESLRREVSDRQGDSFDLRAFHDAILAHAAIPLSTLRSIYSPSP
jgi:uncharacterized protein (DUF885 family)